MNRTIALFAIVLAAGMRPAAAAELKIMAPADRAVVGGTVQFRVLPRNTAMEQYFSDPDVVIEDEYGQQVAKLVAVRDPKTGICSVPFDTFRYPDGLYNVTVRYRSLMRGQKPVEIREDMILGVRNGQARPAKFAVELEDKGYSGDEPAEVTVKVYDQRGRLMPAARVAFKVDRGEVDSPAEITDSEGEAAVSVDSEEVQTVTLTITVEGLAPVTKTLRFVK